MCTGNKSETKVSSCKGSCSGTANAPTVAVEPAEQFKKCHESAETTSDDTEA